MVRFRFFGPLNDFLPYDRRRKTFVCAIRGTPSVKDSIEALGVPHPEVGAVVVNGRPVNFSYRTCDGDRVRVYPVGQPATRAACGALLRPQRPGRPRFVCDQHLGTLARRLRLLGFDTLYRDPFPDPDIAAAAEKRIVLTRDVGLLKHNAVIDGYWPRSTDPAFQLKEIVRRFELRCRARPFTRCIACNGRLRRVSKASVLSELLPDTARRHRRFLRCRECRKIYWPGSHSARLQSIVRGVRPNA